MSAQDQPLTPWDPLSPGKQLELRESYGHYPDSLPPTRSMETIIEHFQRWLAEEHDVSYVHH